VFLHNYANAIWSLKELEGPPIFVLVTFLHHTISIMLQQMQTSCILSWAIGVGLVTSQIPTLQNTPPIAMVDLLQAIGC
jgi:hypothetical protein